MYKFIDLFCGIGGFRLALEEKGLECAFSSDIDKTVQQTYYKNFKETPFGDIAEVPEKKIPPHDILCAGFPCQPFSISGNRQGINDDRGRLFYEIIRIANYHQPYVLLLENVKNILTIDGGNVIKSIEHKLSDIGYEVHRHVLNASHFGVPQARERVYFVCLRKDTKSDYKLSYKPPEPSLKKIFLDDILEKNPDENLFINRDDIVVDLSERRKELKPIRIGHVNKGGQGERIYSPNGHAITISAYGGGVGAKTGLYLDNGRVRKLSVNECKSVMGFPKSHQLAEGRGAYQQLGNAVIPAMISHVYDSIKVA